ncbi:MAG: hypothetical protein EOP02_22585, partial [Proteobacteria bacterium]
MRRLTATTLLSVALISSTALARTPAAPTPAAALGEPAPLSELVAKVDIPYEQFVLPNGLTTLVH